MPSLFAGIHIPNKPSEFLSLDNIDFESMNVLQLKEALAEKLQYDANNMEIVYSGEALDDDLELRGFIRPNATVHCFSKTRKYVPHIDSTTAETDQVQELFNVISHIQINVNSRVNILQKILAEYPDFRRNLGAQALIRDSVLFNTLHQPEVIQNIAEHYPIICEAAPFIVHTIKKELARNSSMFSLSEPATDSTNSSEEDNSLGPSTSSAADSGGASGSQSEHSRFRQISRQQLQSALAQIGFGSSFNSLSNIAQRNSDLETNASTSAPLSTSASGERISSEQFRNELQRALTTVSQQLQQQQTPPGSAEALSTHDLSDDGSGDVPLRYRAHQYVEQLRTMQQMGFTNYEENLTYLNITNGNIENAVNLLMGAMN